MQAASAPEEFFRGLSHVVALTRCIIAMIGVFELVQASTELTIKRTRVCAK